MKLLLERGASVVVKSDDGDTPLQILKRWRTNAELDSIQQTLYETIVASMTETLEKTRHAEEVVSEKSKPNINRTSTVTNPDEEIEKGLYYEDPLHFEYISHDKYGENASIYEVSSTINDSSNEPVDRSENIAVKEYKNVMNQWKHKFGDIDKKQKSRKSIKQPAIVEGDVPDDDWLDDDLGPNLGMKKRKTEETDAYLNSFNVRKRLENESPKFDRFTNRSCNSEVHDINEHASETDAKNECVTQKSSTKNKVRSSLMSSKSHKRKRQTSLIRVGFYRTRTSSNISHTENAPIKSQLLQEKNKNMDMNIASTSKSSCDGLVCQNNSNLEQEDGMLSVDVRINGKLYKIPVQMSQIHNLTIKWLGKEAARRYSM